MLVNNRELDVSRAIHDVSMEAARIEVEIARTIETSLKDEKDISAYLNRLFSSYISNFAELSKLTDDEIRRRIEGG